MTERTMPIQLGSKFDLRVRQDGRLCVVRSLPWAMIDGEFEREQAQKNHGQSPAELAARCGVSAGEAIAILTGAPYDAVPNEEHAHRILYAMRALYRRGALADRVDG